MSVVPDNHCTAKAFYHARIVLLLAILMERIRNEDGSAGSERDLRNGHRAGARDHKIGALKSVGDIVYEWSNFRLERKAPISGPYQLLIRLPSLVDDGEIYNTICTDFESFYDTNIQPMSAARAS